MISLVYHFGIGKVNYVILSPCVFCDVRPLLALFHIPYVFGLFRLQGSSCFAYVAPTAILTQYLVNHVVLFFYWWFLFCRWELAFEGFHWLIVNFDVMFLECSSYRGSVSPLMYGRTAIPAGGAFRSTNSKNDRTNPSLSGLQFVPMFFDQS